MAESRLREWESAARSGFLNAYRQTIANSQAALVPEPDESFVLALRAWELDKALYEVAYEARNRPSWLAIPLAVLVPERDDPIPGTPNS
jgi:maltokinase